MRAPAMRAATALLLLVLIPCSARAANDYWTYTCQGIEVTAQGDSAFTVKLTPPVDIVVHPARAAH